MAMWIMFEPDWLGIRDGVKLLGQSLQSQVNAMADYSRLLIDDEWMIKLLYTRIKTVMKRTHFCRKEQTSCYFFFKCMCLFWRSSLHSVESVIYWWRKPTIYERWTLCIGSPLANLIKKEQKQTTASKWVLKWFRLLFFLFFFFS